MSNDDFPPLTEAVVKALELRFPDRAPNPSDADREIWLKVGRIEVVRFLREQLTIQQEEALDRV